MQLASYALTTVDRLTKAFDGLEDDDAAMLINVASELIGDYLSRSLGFAIVPTSAPLLLPGSGSLELYLPRWPIRSVEQVLEYGSEVTDYTVVDQKALYRRAGWPIYAQCSGRLVADPDPRLVERSISVAYTAGYILPQWDGIPDAANNPAGAASDLPFKYQQACLWACLDWLEGPTPGLIGERTPGGWSQQWLMTTRPTLSERAMGALAGDGGFWF